MAWLVIAALMLALYPSSAAARAGGLGKRPVMGWNTWCTEVSCGVDWCSSSEIASVAGEIKSSGMLAAGYDHILLDDCWGTRNSTTGSIQGDSRRFPEGMPAFIEKIHGMGFKFGLYTDIGEHACHSPFVGSFPHYRSDAETFADWKVDYVKFDGCNVPGLKNGNGDNATAIAVVSGLVKNMSVALNATGRDMWLNFHCWNQPPGDARCAEYGNSFRVYDDHSDTWASTVRVISFMMHRQEWWGADPERGWPDMDFVFTGGQGCGGDEIVGKRCPGQSEDEYISEFSLWVVAGGQIVLATEPRNMSGFQRQVLLNKNALDVFKDTSSFGSIAMIGEGTVKPESAEQSDGGCSVSMVPNSRWHSHGNCTLGVSYGCTVNIDGSSAVWTAADCGGVFTCDDDVNIVCESWGQQNTSCPCITTQVWARPLVGGAAAVALFNPSNATQAITVQFSAVPERAWSGASKLDVHDVWGNVSSTATGSFTASAVPRHGTALVVLRPMGAVAASAQ